MEDSAEIKLQPEYTQEELESNKRILLNLNINQDYRFKLPESVLLNIIVYLELDEVSNLACSCKTLRRVSYNPCLWKVLDLLKIWTKVDDNLIAHLLTTSKRFSRLEEIKLDLCRAITKKTLRLISRNCKGLKVLTLVRCNELKEKHIFEFLQQTPSLEKVELNGCKVSLAGLQNIINKFPDLDIGSCINHLSSFKNVRYTKTSRVSTQMASFSQQSQSFTVSAFQYSAENSFRDSSASSNEAASPGVYIETPATCDYSREFSAGGCWGELSSFIIFSDDVFKLSGNFPRRVVFTCAAHKAEVSGRDAIRCEMCKTHVEERSASNEVICKFCVDRMRLSEKLNWIPLSNKSLADFSFGNLWKALSLANPKNLPMFIRKIGSVKVDVDLSSFAPLNAPKTSFKSLLDANALHFEDFSNQIADILKREAARNSHSKGILVHGENSSVDVYISRGDINQRTHNRAFFRAKYLSPNFWPMLSPLLVLLCLVCASKGLFSVENALFVGSPTKFLRPLVPVVLLVFCTALFFLNTIVIRHPVVLRATHYITLGGSSFTVAAALILFLFNVSKEFYILFDAVSVAIWLANLVFVGSALFLRRFNFRVDAFVRGVVFNFGLCYLMSLSRDSIILVLACYFVLEIVIKMTGMSNRLFNLYRVKLSPERKDIFFQLKYKCVFINYYHFIAFALIVIYMEDVFVRNIVTVVSIVSIITTLTFAAPLFGYLVRPSLLILPFVFPYLHIFYWSLAKVIEAFQFKNSLGVFLPL